MGRPINKRYFGNTGVNALPTIPVQAAYINGEEKFDEGGAELYIVKQKGARRFIVSSKDDPAQANCKLVNKVYDGSSSVVLAEGEMVIIGYMATSGQAVAIQRLGNRIAWDFDGRMHKWSLSDDSTTTVMVLTRP